MLSLRSVAVRTSRSARSYATRWPRPRPGTSERPPYYASDPLADNPKSAETQLADEDLTFIHRPPPTAPSPISYTTNPTSPLLRPWSAATDTSLPPPVRPSADKTPPTRVSSAVIEKIRQLRSKDPATYTRGVLAKMFGTTQNFIALVAALKKPLRKKVRAKQEAKHQAARERWTERHSIVKEIAAKRKTYW